MDTRPTSTPGPAEVTPAEHGRSLRKAAMLTAGFGLAHAVLFLISYWLASSAPGPNASDAEIVRYYESEDDRRLVLAGLYLMPFAGIAFIWFIVSLRMWISGSIRRENVLFSNIQLVSGILYIALFFGAAASSSVMSASVEFSESEINPDLARQFPEYANALFFVFAIRMAAMFVFTSTNMARAAGILPRWFTVVGIIVGLFLLLSATFSQALIVVFPAWLFILCTILFLRGREIPRELRMPPGTLVPGEPMFVPPRDES